MLYQPRIDPLSGVVFGAEALVRWNHPVRGKLLPKDFLHIAEECGIILQVENIVITSVFTRIKERIDAGYEPLVVAINLSNRMLRQSDFKYYNTRQPLHDIPASSISVELLGDSLMGANEDALKLLSRDCGKKE